MAITVFLADDHGMVRDGLRRLLEAEADIRVVGDAANGREAIREEQRLKPSIVVMDIAMPELNGIDATRAIRETGSASRILILSMYYSAEHVFQAFQAGAQGYLLKESARTANLAVGGGRIVERGDRQSSALVAEDGRDLSEPDDAKARR